MSGTCEICGYNDSYKYIMIIQLNDGEDHECCNTEDCYNALVMEYEKVKR